MEENIIQQNTICSDKMDADTKERVNILELRGKNNGKNKNSQMDIIVNIFHNNIDIKLHKREIEKLYSLEFGLKQDITNERLKNEPIIIKSIDEIMNLFDKIPGDVQRQLRTFHDKFKNYGLIKLEEGSEIYYIWSPILKSELDIVVHPVARNIFSHDKHKEAFIESRQGKCEICSSETRLAIDHWRAHSIYNINHKDIAVLLCEKCNNKHHNRDAINCILPYKNNIQFIKNWNDIEKRIVQLGYLPNDKDLEEQKKIKSYIDNYWQDNHKYTMKTLINW